MSSGSAVEVRSSTEAKPKTNWSKRFSATKLDTWQKCPLQAKFRYIDRLQVARSAYMAFGIIVHAVLERHYKNPDIEAAVEYFNELWSDPEKTDAAIDYWPENMDWVKFKERGEECVTKWCERQQLDKGRLIASEHRFLVPFGDFELTGVVDALEERTGRGGKVLRVVDYKTGMYVPRISALNLNIQLTTYAYASMQPEFWMGNGPEFPGLPQGDALYQIYKDSPRIPVWFCLPKGKETDSRVRNDEDFLRLYRLCKEIHHAESQGVYVPKISEDTCPLCDFNRECGIPIDDYEESLY